MWLHIFSLKLICKSILAFVNIFPIEYNLFIIHLGRFPAYHLYPLKFSDILYKAKVKVTFQHMDLFFCEKNSQKQVAWLCISAGLSGTRYCIPCARSV